MNPYKLNLSKFSTHNTLVNLIGEKKKVLDIGCNEGYIGITTNLNEFYGIDYAAESVEKAKQVYKDAVVYDLNNLKRLPWNLRFDVLIFADVLEHVLFADQVLDFFIQNYLKEGGEVIFSLPNIANWRIRLQLLFGNFDYTDSGILDKTHLHFYTFKSAKKLVEASSLKITTVTSGASFFGYILKILPILKNLLATNIIIVACND